MGKDISTLKLLFAHGKPHSIYFKENMKYICLVVYFLQFIWPPILLKLATQPATQNKHVTRSWDKITSTTDNESPRQETQAKRIKVKLIFGGWCFTGQVQQQKRLFLPLTQWHPLITGSISCPTKKVLHMGLALSLCFNFHRNFNSKEKEGDIRKRVEKRGQRSLVHSVWPRLRVEIQEVLLQTNSYVTTRTNVEVSLAVKNPSCWNISQTTFVSVPCWFALKTTLD